IRTRTLEELFDVATVLANQPVPGGRRVAIVTNAGGPAILAADACEANGLDVSVLSDATQKTLRTLLPPAASVSNPVDMIASATPEQYRKALEIVAADAAVDSIIAIFIPPLVTEAAAVADAIREAAAHVSKPVLASFLGTQGLQPQLAPVPSRLVATADEAVAAAKEVGLPVVLKAVGPAIVHKSDVGGVRLALGSESAVRDAYSALTKSLGDRARAILVQPMVSGAVEMVVGGVNDPSFGPVVMCGLGGVLVDVLDDTAFALCPLSPSAARALVDRIKGRVCLRGFR